MLEKIGRRNAEYIRHVIIEFSDVSSTEPGHVTLKDEFADNLANIRSHCTDLHAIRLYHWRVFLLGDDEPKPEVVTGALNLADSQLRMIPSL